MRVDRQEIFLQVEFEHVLVKELSVRSGCFHSLVVIVIEDSSLDVLNCVERNSDDGLAIGRQSFLLVLIDA